MSSFRYVIVIIVVMVNKDEVIIIVIGSRSINNSGNRSGRRCNILIIDINVAGNIGGYIVIRITIRNFIMMN